MKDVALRGLPQLAVAVGATTPVPSNSQNSIIWSTTANDTLVWNGTAWMYLGSGINDGLVYTGQALLNFGDGSNEASAIITGIDNMPVDAKIQIWISADDSTGDHSASEHRYLGSIASFTAGNIVSAIGFTVYARSTQKLSGLFLVRFSWEQITSYTAVSSSVPANILYTRPSDWITVPELLSTDQKFVGLYAVIPGDGNYLALSAAGNYQVDWGDGSTTTHSSGATAEHQYTYTSISSTTNCSRGYRQVIVTVTPQSGQNLTSVNLQKNHSALTVDTYYMKSRWLELSISSPNLTTLTYMDVYGIAVIELNLVEKVYIGANALTTCTYLCARMNKLEVFETLYGFPVCTNFSNMFDTTNIKTISVFDTSLGTNFSGMFTSCNQLIEVPIFNTSSALDTSNMFGACLSLEVIPDLNLSAVTDANHMFASCLSLKHVSLNLPNCTNFISMFDGCSTIRYANIQCASATDMTNMFQYCYALEDIYLSNTSNVTLLYQTFFGAAIKHGPAMDTSSVTNMTSLFSNVYITDIPLYDTSNVLNFSAMFASSKSLKTIPLLNTSSGTNFLYMFSGSGISNIPALNVSNCTDGDMLNFADNCTELQSCDIVGTKLSISYAYAKLSASALNNIYTNLATVSGKTITVTGNPGVSGDNPAIATGKGWTVVG
jgi:hypothetical protein